MARVLRGCDLAEGATARDLGTEVPDDTGWGRHLLTPAAQVKLAFLPKPPITQPPLNPGRELNGRSQATPDTTDTMGDACGRASWSGVPCSRLP